MKYTRTFISLFSFLEKNWAGRGAESIPVFSLFGICYEKPERWGIMAILGLREINPNRSWEYLSFEMWLSQCIFNRLMFDIC